MNKQRLEFATIGFLSEMRRQWAILHPGEPCPVKNFADYPMAERSALMSSVKKSIDMMANDALFTAWQKKRRAEAEAAAAE